jgi:hypothetical protein
MSHDPDAALRDKARRAIDAGRLPITLKTPPIRRGVGPAAQCVVCELPIGAGQPDVQLEASPGAGGYLHVPCYNAWRWVCEELEPTATVRQLKPP